MAAGIQNYGLEQANETSPGPRIRSKHRGPSSGTRSISRPAGSGRRDRSGTSSTTSSAWACRSPASRRRSPLATTRMRASAVRTASRPDRRVRLRAQIEPPRVAESAAGPRLRVHHPQWKPASRRPRSAGGHPETSARRRAERVELTLTESRRCGTLRGRIRDRTRC